MTDEAFMSAFGLEIYTDDQKTLANDIISKLEGLSYDEANTILDCVLERLTERSIVS